MRTSFFLEIFKLRAKIVLVYQKQKPALYPNPATFVNMAGSHRDKERIPVAKQTLRVCLVSQNHPSEMGLGERSILSRIDLNHYLIPHNRKPKSWL
jgi:hypothetical protein